LSQSHGHAEATLPPRRLTRALLAAAVLAATLLAAPAAPAASTEDVVAAVGSEVNAVTEGATKALPDLPMPVETPPVPEVPEAAPPPSASKPPPSPSTPSPIDTVRSVVPDLDREAGAPAEVEGPGALPDPEAGGAPDARGVTRPGRHSVGPAETAPRRHGRAYVWPAVALRVIGGVLTPLTRLGGSLDVHIPDVFGLPSSPADAAPAGAGTSSARPGPPTQEVQSPSPSAGPLSEAGASLLVTLLIVLLMGVGLVSLARLWFGEELFEIQHWRGHRG
jgi:hypothetical protein